MAYWLTIELEHCRIAPLPTTMDTQAEGLVYGATVPQLLQQLDRILTDLEIKGTKFAFVERHDRN